jgi:hypothetical protein
MTSDREPATTVDHDDQREDLIMWTVYKPEAGQHSHKAREIRCTTAGVVETGNVAVGPLEVIRGYFAEHLLLTRMDRSPEDDPSIVETWL